MPKRANKIVTPAEIVKISEGPKELLAWFKLLNALPNDYAAYREKTGDILAQRARALLETEAIEEAEERYYKRYRELIGPTIAGRIAAMRIWDGIAFVESLYAGRSILAMMLTVLSHTDPDTPSLRILGLITAPLQISKRKKIPFPIERVRVCPVCGDFHWARRRDAKTCGRTSCANTLGNLERSKPRYEDESNDPIGAKAGVTIKKRSKK